MTGVNVMGNKRKQSSRRSASTTNVAGFRGKKCQPTATEFIQLNF